MDLDKILNKYKEPRYDMIEHRYRKKYNELKEFTFIKKDDLVKMNLGGVLKFISRETHELKTAILMSVHDINNIVKLLKVKNLAYNNIYKLKASNYYYFYKHNIYNGVHSILEPLKKNK